MNQLSFCAFRLNVMAEGLDKKWLSLGTATGFLYKKDNIIYLITNRHVVTGKDNDSHKYINSLAQMPSDILIQNIWQYSDVSKKSLNNKRHVSLQLYDEDDNKPIWLIHPKYGEHIDVVACPLWKFEEGDELDDMQEYSKLHCITDIPFTDEMDINVADDVFVIGYPFGNTAVEKSHMPIWKRATIASEPYLNYFSDGRPSFLIDTTTRPGMSGAPVIAYAPNGYKNKWGKEFKNKGTKLLGVYSGRSKFEQKPHQAYLENLSNTQVEAIIDEYETRTPYLGVVWKKEIIDEIIAGNRRDDKYED